MKLTAVYFPAFAIFVVLKPAVSSMFDVSSFCRQRCVSGSGGVLCKCSANHFSGKRATSPITSPLVLNSLSSGDARRKGFAGGDRNMRGDGPSQAQDNMAAYSISHCNKGRLGSPRPMRNTISVSGSVSQSAHNSHLPSQPLTLSSDAHSSYLLPGIDQRYNKATVDSSRTEHARDNKDVNSFISQLGPIDIVFPDKANTLGLDGERRSYTRNSILDKRFNDHHEELTPGRATDIYPTVNPDQISDMVRSANKQARLFQLQRVLARAWRYSLHGSPSSSLSAQEDLASQS